MKIDEMADVFQNSANFWQHAFSTLAPPSSYTMNLKTLKLADLNETLEKDKLHFSKKTPPKS